MRHSLPRIITNVMLALLLLPPLARSQETHPPMRPLPVARDFELADGPRFFVDAARGDDTAEGSENAPFATLKHALRQLKPGDTLYLRGGVYHEQLLPTKSGVEGQPITISSYPGELATIDGGLREFLEDPAGSWEPYEGEGGAGGEFVSTRTYPNADERRVPNQFLPSAWEPMLGLEEDRPMTVGHFAGSMVPLHGYRLAVDLRAENEFRLAKTRSRDTGVYCGPGVWFNRETNRIHIRLAHNRLEGLGDRAYRGETDPRKLPLVVALGFGEEVARLTGVQHLRLRDLMFRGATGSPMIHIYGAHGIELERVTIYGGFPALLLNASTQVSVRQSAFRGLAAPWSSRSSMKYFGVPSYQIILQDNQPLNEDIEFANCEFTDDHDFAFIRNARNLRFHHNFVDNFNDDGLECGPKLRDHTIYIYQNRIGPCLIPLTQHELKKDESPLDHDPDTGVFVYRNVFDLRAGTYKGPPEAPDPTGAFLHGEGHLVGDHGGPTWPVIRAYHNTFLRQTPVFRDYYLFGLGAQALRRTERDVFNNIFVQMEKVPGVNLDRSEEPPMLREGGNLIWGVADGPARGVDPFEKYRASKEFEASKLRYAAGWTTHDRVADPKFVDFSADLRLQPGSPAIDFGQQLPTAWPDPLRDSDAGKPDAGALPLGVDSWGVGIDGRIPLFGPL